MRPQPEAGHRGVGPNKKKCDKAERDTRMSPKKYRRDTIYIMIIFLILGFVVSTQIKSVAMKQYGLTAEEKAELDKCRSEISKLDDEIEQNKQKLAGISARYDEQLHALYEQDQQFYNLYKKYETDIEQYKYYACLTPVTGPGIDIGLDDAQKKSDTLPTFIVHDIYINELLNVLRAAGAEAISVNGERIVPMSESLCLGPSIRINNTRLFPPYHIYAVGDPDMLLAAVRDSVIYKNMVSENLIVDPVVMDQITVAPYNKSYASSISMLEIKQ